MIDLGDELAGFGEELPRPASVEPPAAPTYYDRGPNGMRTFGKLADLQKQGFNVSPRTVRGIGTPRRGFGMQAGSLPNPLTDDSRWTFAGTFDDDDLKIDVRTWFGDDDVNPYLLPDQQFPMLNQKSTDQSGSAYVIVTPNIPSNTLPATISVPDQPFKWKPHVVASRMFAAKCRHGIAAGTCRRCAK